MPDFGSTMFTANTLIQGPGAGTVYNLSYNDWVFPPASNIKASITPVFEEGSVNATAHELVLEISLVLLPGMAGNMSSIDTGSATNPEGKFEYSLGYNVTVDDAIDTFKSKVLKNGGYLVCRLQGYGDIQVRGRNVAQGSDPNLFTLFANPAYDDLLDIGNGPVVEIGDILTFGKLAAKITCKITTRYRPCVEINQISQDITPLKNLIDAPFTVRSTYDKSGYLTRIIEGRLKTIHIPRDVVGTLARSADDYRGVLAQWFPAIVKYQRIYDLRLSSDRTTLDFTITDREEPYNNYPLYPHMVNMDFKYNVRSTLEDASYGGFVNWRASLSGTITVAPTVSKVRGWFVFLDLMFRLMAYSQNARRPSGPPVALNDISTANLAVFTGSDDVGEGVLRNIMLKEIELEDDLYSQEMTISVTWLLTCNLDDIILGTGLFQRLPSVDVELPGLSQQEPYKGLTTNQIWDLHKQAAELYQTPTGTQPNIRFISATDDAIFRMCEDPQFPIIRDYAVANYQEQLNFTSMGLINEDPKNSYIKYTQQVEIHQDLGQSGVARLEPNSSPTRERPQTDVHATDNPEAAPASSQNASSGFTVPPAAVVTTSHGKDGFIIVVSGQATRVGRRAAIPHYETYGGQPVTPVGHAVVSHRIIGHGTRVVGGKSYPIYQTTYAKKYRVHGRPVLDQQGQNVTRMDGDVRQISVSV